MLTQYKKIVGFISFLFLLCIFSLFPILDIYGFELKYWSVYDDESVIDYHPFMTLDLNEDVDIRLPSLDKRILLLNQYNDLMSASNSSFDIIPTEILSFDSHYVIWKTPLSNIVNATTGVYYDSEGNLVTSVDLLSSGGTASEFPIYCLLIYGSTDFGDYLVDYNPNSGNSRSKVFISSGGKSHVSVLFSSNKSIPYWYTYYFSVDGKTWYNPRYSSSTNKITSGYDTDSSIIFSASSKDNGLPLFSDMNIGNWVYDTSTEIYNAVVHHPASPLPDSALNGFTGDSGDSECIHIDEDSDGLCDICGSSMSSDECIHIDEDSDGLCDICGSSMSSEGCIHIDEDGDGLCDICGLPFDGTTTDDEKDQNIIQKAISAVFGDLLESGKRFENFFVSLWDSISGIYNFFMELLFGDLLPFIPSYVKVLAALGLSISIILIVAAWIPTL